MKKIFLIIGFVLITLAGFTQTTEGWAQQRSKINFKDSINIAKGWMIDGTIVLPSVAEINFLDGVSSALQSQINLKANLASPTFTGTVTIPSPFTLGATSVTSTGTQLNYLNGATGTTGTGSIVLSTSPTFTGHPTIEGVTSTGATGSGDLVFATSPTLTGTVTIPTPFTLGATSVTANGTELNVLDNIPATLTSTELGYSDGVTSAIQAQLDARKYMPYDYYIESSGGTYYARPNPNGSLTAYSNAAFHTVFNNAVTALDAAGGGTIVIKDGSYAVTSRLQMIDVANITVVGQGNVQITKAVDDATSTPHSILYMADSLVNIKISNITFNNTTTDAVEVNEGCIHLISVAPDYLDVDGVEISDCTFSTENMNMRGIQVYATPGASKVNNLRIVRNKFINVYNMIVEVLNQETPWVQDKITNCYYSENYAYNCGAGFSFGGAQTRIDVSHNQFYEVGSGAIETGSISNATIIGNTVVNSTKEASFLTTSNTYGACYNLTVQGNVHISKPLTPDGYSLKTLYILNADSVIISDNKFWGERPEISGSDYIWVTNNHFITSGYSALLVYNASTNCHISHNFFDNTDCYGGTNQGTLFFSGSGTTNNTAFDNVFTDAGGDGAIVEGNSATGNAYTNNWDATNSTFLANNGANTVTMAGDDETIFTTTANTSLTLPIAGTLATTQNINDSLNNYILLEDAIDTTNIYATKHDLTLISTAAYDSAYIHYRVDSLEAVITNMKAEIESLWDAIDTLGAGDLTPPHFTSAEIGTWSDDTVHVVFDEPLDETSVPAKIDFTLTDNGTPVTIDSVTISTDTVFLKLNTAATGGHTYLLDYTSGTNKLRDVAENNASSFIDNSVTNNLTPGGLLDGLVAYWKFDETSGTTFAEEVNGNDATGTSTINSSSGKINYGVKFDAASDHINVPFDESLVLTGDECSFSFWMYLDSLASSTNRTYYILKGHTDGSNAESYSIYISPTDDRIHFRMTNNSDVSFLASTDEDAYSINTWYNVVCTLSEGTLSIYVNGVESATYQSDTFTGTIFEQKYATLIATLYHDWFDYAPAGVIDEIGIWNRAINQSEVNSLYGSGSGNQYPF